MKVQVVKVGGQVAEDPVQLQALLKGFDQIWDASQRTGIQKMISMISGESDEAGQKEN